jgi:aminopeptidase N
MRGFSATLPFAWLAMAACAAEAPPPPPTPPVATVPATVAPLPPEPPPPPRDDGRLPALATAQRYDLSLSIDPAAPGFTGAVRILVQVPAATWYVVLNGRGVNVTHAAAQSGTDMIAATVAARTSHGGHTPEELVLTFERPLAAGPAVLELRYGAPFDESHTGLYRVSEGGRWYAFTQFEANDARRAFPCFDEPSQKVPFDVHLTVPRGLLAFSNMPEVRHTDSAEAPTTTTFDFATSPPLPTYLVAFAVGDLDVRPGSPGPIPIRLITTRGNAHLGELALDNTAALVRELSSTFGVRYPYPKLDIVAVPYKGGAMENAGLVTFSDELLLLDPAHAPERARLAQAEVIAHELAHQWFGDLVTSAWWDDIWLNEAFATWAEAKVVERWRPSFHAQLERVAYLGEVMSTDSLKSARAVRQPVHSTDEAMEAFDGMTYDKGAAVIGMMERLVGEESFRRGIQTYLKQNAWRAATADDLLRALGTASGKDVARLATTFLDRPGVPGVTVAMDCAAKPPTVTLSQAPWHLLGDSDATGDAVPPWFIPVGLRTSQEELRVVLSDRSATFPMTRCPAWVVPNSGGDGYYRYSLDEKQWTALAAVLPRQDEATRLTFLTSLWAQVRAGTLGPDVLLRLLPALDTETSRVVLDSEMGVLFQLRHQLVSPEAAPAFARYVSARLLPHQRALAKASAKGQAGEDEALERRSLFSTLGQLGDDPSTLAEANKLTLMWLSDPARVDSDLARAAVVLGSRRAGPERIDALRAAMKRAKTPNDRKTALIGLAGFDDPSTLGRALAVALSDEIAIEDASTLIMAAVYRPSTRRAASDWVLNHWAELRAKLPGALAGRLFYVAGRACTGEEVDRASAFFTPKVDEVEGTRRPLAEALESASLCRTLREKAGAKVDRFFKVKPASPE